MLLRATLLVCWLSLSGATSAAEGDRPNIVIILADDLGSGDLGCYNDESKIPTPHLDQLAREGMRFTDAHSPSAVCTPTRYGLLTGRYCWRSRLKSGVLGSGYGRALIEPGRSTVATMLRDLDYETCAIGKWHLGFDWASTNDQPVTVNKYEHVNYTRPVERGLVDAGFDSSFVFPASLDMKPYCYLVNDRVLHAPTDRVEGSNHRRQDGGGFWRAGPASPGFRFEMVLPRLIDEAVEFLHARANAENDPFFLYLPLTAPHTPWVPLEEFRGASQAGHYGDFVAQVDASIGRVLGKLDELGMRDNTLVIVASDNGAHWPVGDIEKWGHRANLGYRGQKADIWEGGHRVPMLVRWPGRVDPGAVNDELVGLIDIYATIAAIVGAKARDDAAEDSVNLLPTLRSANRDRPARKSIVHHSANGTFAIRKGPWKLIEKLGSGGFTSPKKVKPAEDGPQGQLYNMQNDPGETENVWSEYPDIVADLQQELDRIRGKTK